MMENNPYIQFLKTKIEIAVDSGFHITADDLNPILKPHQKDAIIWAVKGGKRALFESFGLGKTIQQLEILRVIIVKEGGKALIVCPLGVRQEFKQDAENLLHIKVEYVRTMAEIKASTADILITNYERVRDGDINPEYFTATSLDEAAVLRSYGSLTYQSFLQKFKNVKYKFVCTACPSPNKYKELIHYAGYLGVMDTGQALTRFFQRDSTQANNLTLYKHKEEEFWLWVSTWAIFITKPSDLNYDDTGYDLPPMEVIYHEVPVDHLSGPAERDGQAKLFRDASTGLKEASREKRDSIKIRVERIRKIIYDFPCMNSLKQGAQHGPRSEEDLYERVPLEEQREVRCKGENILCQELPRQSGYVQRESQEMERGESGKNEGITEKLQLEEQRKSQCEIVAMVSGQQRKSFGNCEKSETCDVRPNSGSVHIDVERSGRGLCDMPDTCSSEGETESACGSLSRDQRSEGAFVPPLQCGAGGLQGQCRVPEKCNRVFEQVVIWCDLNDEQTAIEIMLKEMGISFSSVTGNQSADEKERLLFKWRDGETTVLLSKLKIFGSGVNLQQSCKMIYAGIGYKFSDFIQGLHREFRFGQLNHVNIHIIYTESEKAILETLLKKWKQHDYLVGKMTDLIRNYGLSTTSVIDKLARKIGVKRVKIEGQFYTAVNNDCVLETAMMEENSIDLIHTSIPFSNHYEYTPSYNDFGHNENNDRFFEQMGFLTDNLLRILKPGRVAAIHVKDRVMFGNATGTGMPTIDPFHVDCIQHYRQHGFQYFGMITVITDVVRENNQTYRLGWTEQCKDGSKMGVGCPEYVLLFRKLPTDTTTAYADETVTKTKTEYTRAQWQLDAHAFWRSSGNRLVNKEELENISVSDLQRVYRDFSRETVYSYEDHVALAKKLDTDGRLPATFMVVAPGSWTDEVWDDINRMRTLNSDQVRRNVQMHVCPLQHDIIERIINRYSNKGDVVFDPFGGIGSVPYNAVKMGRKGYMTELNSDYFRDAIGYLQAAEQEVGMPSLFDFLEAA